MDKKYTMKEYIEREALIAEYDRRYYPIRIGEPPGARKLIENAPTADVVEVVRCGECIHSKERKIKDTVICSKYNAYKDINGFCEAGEKKKDGE
jgi:hypothetical protein